MKGSDGMLCKQRIEKGGEVFANLVVHPKHVM